MKPIHAHLMLQIFLYSWNLRKLLLVVQKRFPEDLCQSWKRIHPSDNHIDSDMEISDGMAAQDGNESSEESSSESQTSDPED